MVTLWPWARPKTKARRKPSPIGVATRPRLHLLAEIERGRVRYLVGSGVVRWRPHRGYGDPVRTPVDVTARVGELVRSKWARHVPPGSELPPPHELPVAVTDAGALLLIGARMKARKRRRAPWK